MIINILGCSGGKWNNFKTTSFLIDNHILLDAGTACEKLSFDDLKKIDTVVLTHSHYDHISDLPHLAVLRNELESSGFNIYALQETIGNLKKHIFNWYIWPDFTQIPNAQNPIINYIKIDAGHIFKIEQYEIMPIAVEHTIDTVGYLFKDGNSGFAFTGDTYVTNEFWSAVSKDSRIKKIIADVSYPNRLHKMAESTKHLTPKLLLQELNKLNGKEIELLITHLKPTYRLEIMDELEEIKKNNKLVILKDGMTIKL